MLNKINKNNMQKVKRSITVIIAFAAIYAANAQTPSWKTDAERCQYKYQNNMTIYAQLYIDGEISADGNDMIGIFYGDECRGAASNDYEYEGQKYSLITVYGNGYGEEKLIIKIYEASSGKIYDLKQYIYFYKDSIMGELDNPIVFYTNLTEKKLNAYNFFTPNGDGKNDYFIVEDDLTTVRDMTFKVYTFRGEEVYQQKDYDNTWNGVSKNGKDLPQGTYYYLFVDEKGKTIYKGSVTLVR